MTMDHVSHAAMFGCLREEGHPRSLHENRGGGCVCVEITVTIIGVMIVVVVVTRHPSKKGAMYVNEEEEEGGKERETRKRVRRLETMVAGCWHLGWHLCMYAL